MRSDRRPFAERGFNARALVIPYSEFKLMTDMPSDAMINDELGADFVTRAEKVLEEEIPLLPLSLYREYRKTGNRHNFEKYYFARRYMLYTLTMAEAYERQGRFVDKLSDVLWAILDEAGWIIPAHFGHYPENPGQPIPEPFRESQIYGLDLFSAATCALMALVKYLMKNELDAISPIICEKMDFYVLQRGVRPFVNVDFFWLGDIKGQDASNWTTSVTSNILFAVAMCAKDQTLRCSAVQKAMHCLDNFTASYPNDGSCEEGPEYWSGAGGSYFDSLEIIEDMTGGRATVYDDPIVKNIGDYMLNVNINRSYYLNFSDANPWIGTHGKLFMRYGKKCELDGLYSFGKKAESESGPMTGVSAMGHFYRMCKNAFTPEVHEGSVVNGKEAYWFDGNKIAIFRENTDTGKGLYLATKGGTNGESHNHMDVGALVVYSDGKPVIIDPGKGSYNHGYFQTTRYLRWYLRASAHSIPTVNGMEQKVGCSTTNPKEIAIGLTSKSSEEWFDAATKTVSMELATAFAEEVGVISMRRTCHMDRGFLTVTDDVKLREEGDINFNYTLLDEPKMVENGKVAVSEGRFIEYDPEGVEAVIERMENTNLPYEDLDYKGVWGRECLWRLVLKVRAKEKKFTITVR